MATYGYCEKKGKHEVYTKDEVDNLLRNVEVDAYSKTEVDTKISNAVNELNLGTIATHNYSRGTAAPSGGSDGDIYDQYFE